MVLRFLSSRIGVLVDEKFPFLRIKNVSRGGSLSATKNIGNSLSYKVYQVHDRIPVFVVCKHGDDKKGAKHGNDPNNEECFKLLTSP